MKTVVATHTMTMANNTYVRLSSDVYICNGYCNSLIMDCNTNKIFQLDSEANDLLGGFLNGKKYVFGVNKEADKLIGFLQEKALINLTERHIKSVLLPPKAKEPLQTVWLELRRKCNMHCIHCYNASNPKAETSKLMSVEQWKSIINQLKGYHPKTIVLIGGEPLLYDGLVDLIKYIKEELENIVLVLYSNLTFINDEIINAIKTYDVKIVTSIYANDENIHDSITTHKGSFIKTTTNIKRLKSNGVDVRANTVVMKNNQDVIESTIKYIKDLTGKLPKIDEIRTTDERLNSLLPDKRLKKNTITSIHDINKPTKKKIQKSVSGNSCWQGKINISYDGYVSPCIMQSPESIKKYNLKTASLKSVIDEFLIPNYWELSKDKISTCSVCEFRYLCNDCRPLANALTTRANNCNYDPFSGEWL